MTLPKRADERTIVQIFTSFPCALIVSQRGPLHKITSLGGISLTDVFRQGTCDHALALQVPPKPLYFLHMLNCVCVRSKALRVTTAWCHSGLLRACHSSLPRACHSGLPRVCHSSLPRACHWLAARVSLRLAARVSLRLAARVSLRLDARVSLASRTRVTQACTNRYNAT